MLKRMMIIVLSALGALSARAGSLEAEFKRLCAENGAQAQEMPSEMTGIPAGEVETFVVAEVPEETVSKAVASARTIPEENLWMTVSESGTDLTMYGEELEGGKIALMLLLGANGEGMMIYMRGDRELAKHIEID